MAAERDTDPNLARGGTEPGLGKPSGGGSASAEPAVVDFDALHAALGEPIVVAEDEELVAPAAPVDRLNVFATPASPSPSKTPPPAVQLATGESSGQSSASYSARAHAAPATRAPAADPNVPAVIVAQEDTLPGAPPNMTMPFGSGATLGGPGVSIGNTLRPGAPPHRTSGPPPPLPRGAPGAPGIVAPSTDPRRLGGHPHTSPYAFAPQPLSAAHAAPYPPQAVTLRPAGAAPARPPKSATIVMRRRGPTMKQKLVAFATMLVLVTACGIAVIVWRRPAWIGLDGTATPWSTAIEPASTATATATPLVSATTAPLAPAAAPTLPATPGPTSAAPALPLGGSPGGSLGASGAGATSASPNAASASARLKADGGAPATTPSAKPKTPKAPLTPSPPPSPPPVPGSETR